MNILMIGKYFYGHLSMEDITDANDMHAKVVNKYSETSQ